MHQPPTVNYLPFTMSPHDFLTLPGLWIGVLLIGIERILHQLRRNEQHLIAMVSLMLEEEDDIIEHEPFPIEGLDDE